MRGIYGACKLVGGEDGNVFGSMNAAQVDDCGTVAVAIDDGDGDEGALIV